MYPKTKLAGRMRQVFRPPIQALACSKLTPAPVVEPDQGNGQSAQAIVNVWHMWEMTELYSRKRLFP